jgi:hypothetical protein
MAEPRIGAVTRTTSMLTGWLAEAWEEIHAQRLLIAIILAYVAVAFIVTPLVAPDYQRTFNLYSKPFLLLAAAFLLVVLVGYMIYILAVLRPARPLDYYRVELIGNILAPRRIAAALPMMVMTPWFFSAFTAFKNAIPAIRPFDLDPLFARWDAALHGGVQPWEWLQPLFGYPYVTAAINFAYALWFFVLYLCLFWQIFSLRDRQLRLQFLLSFSLCWILLGTVAATLLSSAGPCYFGRVTGLPDPFEPLTAYLWNTNEIVHLQALEAQDYLWRNYQLKGGMLGGGISAMPSLHLAASTVIALLGWRVHRKLGMALTAFCILILIGSVHLGWHYAIDGYAGIVGGAAIWLMAGRIVRRMANAAGAAP